MPLICPYCCEPLPNMQAACCGERGHAIEEAEEQELQHAAAQAAEDESWH